MANINYTKPNKLEDFSVWCSKKYPLWCKSNFPFIENTFEALDTYGLICKIVQYLNETKQNLNTTEDNVQNIYDFVTNYFDNLNVQNEINNKLDEMSNSGELTELIASYITPFISSQNKIINDIDSKVSSIASGSPAGVYNTLEELQQANPNHSRIYVVLEDGEWYYWKESVSNWVNGGIYQASEIANDSVTYEKIEKSFAESLLLKTLNYYGKYDEIQNIADFALGTQEGTGYYNITRNKKISYDGKITKIFIKVDTSGHTGLLKLSRIKYENNKITVIEEDSNEYPISYGNNEIILENPFKVKHDEYLAFTVTPTTANGYCNIASIYPSEDYSFGLLCNKYQDNAVLVLNTMIPAFDFEIESTNYDINFNENISSWFYGKSWVGYGDSITSGYDLPNFGTEVSDNNRVDTYIKLVAEKNNMEFYNYGTSGRGYSCGSVENYKAYKLIESFNVPNADIVTVAFGTNDYGTLNAENNVEFGQVSDLSSGNTFCSYVKKAFDMLTSIYPNSIIIIMTPIPRPNLENPNIQNKNLVDYAEAIKTISKYYGFYCMDCLSIARSNIKSMLWRNENMIDGVHMSLDYHKNYYAPMVEEQFRIAKAIK